jgi:hypothetical protein
VDAAGEVGRSFLAPKAAVMKIHATVWYIAVKNLVVGCALFYLISVNAALWWTAMSALLYSIVVLNQLLTLEERLNKERAP